MAPIVRSRFEYWSTPPFEIGARCLTDHGNNSCTNGAYWCECGGWSRAEQCGPKVGMENITSSSGRRECREGAADWECWKDASARKTGGLWYSTTSAGYCGDGPTALQPGCTWRVSEVVKVVNKTCSDGAIFSEVEKADAEQCFTACTDSGVGPKRNTTSGCW